MGQHEVVQLPHDDVARAGHVGIDAVHRRRQRDTRRRRRLQRGAHHEPLDLYDGTPRGLQHDRPGAGRDREGAGAGKGQVGAGDHGHLVHG